jgi:hypothetical protein
MEKSIQLLFANSEGPSSIKFFEQLLELPYSLLPAQKSQNLLEGPNLKNEIEAD